MNHKNLTLKLCMFIEKTPDLNLAVQRNRANEAMGPLTTDAKPKDIKIHHIKHVKHPRKQSFQGNWHTSLRNWMKLPWFKMTKGLTWLAFGIFEKKTLAQTSPQAPQQKTKCGMVSLRMARHNVNFYSTIVNFFNFTQLIGAWRSRAAVVTWLLNATHTLRPRFQEMQSKAGWIYQKCLDIIRCAESGHKLW